MRKIYSCYNQQEKLGSAGEFGFADCYVQTILFPKWILGESHIA